MTGSTLHMWARAASVDAAAAGKGASRQRRSSTRSRCACLLAALWRFCPELFSMQIVIMQQHKLVQPHVGMRQSL